MGLLDRFRKPDEREPGAVPALPQKSGVEELDATLAIDPANTTAFHARLDLERQRSGDEARRALIAKLDATGKSWRAGLLVALDHLDHKELAPALAVHRRLLAAFGEQGELLLSIAGDLGSRGHAREALELVGPLYDPTRHGGEPGLNLVRCCDAVGDVERGRALLHVIALLRRPDLVATIDEMTLALDRRAAVQRGRPATATPKINLVILSDPLFFHGLVEPGWLLPRKPPYSRSVALLPWTTSAASAGRSSATSSPARDGDGGHFGRGVAALLAEQVWMHTAHRGAVVLPVVNGVGFAALTEPLSPESVASAWPEEQRGGLLVLSGRHTTEHVTEVVEMELWDAAQARVVHRLRVSAPVGGFDALIAAAERELRVALEPSTSATLLAAKTPRTPTRQAEALASALTLLLAGPRAPLAGMVMGERVVLRRLLRLAQSGAAIDTLDALVCAIFSLRAQHGSEVAGEFTEELVEWFEQAPATSVRVQLLAAPLRALGLTAVWRARREAIVAAAKPAAKEWIARLEGVRS